MNKITLIILGLACALVSAAGIMHTRSYNRPVTYIHIEKRHICDERCTINSSIHYLNSYGSITYYIRIEDNGEPITVYTKLAIPTLEEMLKSNDNKVREEAKRGLKQLGVPAEEINKVKKVTPDQSIKPDFIDFTGKVTSVSMHDRGPHSLADWLIRIDVTEVNKSDPKIQPGKEFAYWVHSPVQFFHEPGEDAIGKIYKLRVFRSKNEKGEKYSGLKVMDEILKQRPLLHDKDASVRRKALSWLVAEADWESIPEIKKLLNDENEQVRKDAADALKLFDMLEEHARKARRPNK